MRELTVSPKIVRIFLLEASKRLIFVRDTYTVIICLHCGGAIAPFFTFCSPNEVQFPFVKMCSCIEQNFTNG